MLINFFVFLKNHVLQIYNFHMTSWAQIFSTFLVQIFLFSSFFYDSLQQQPSEKYYVNKLEFKICFQQSVLDYYYQQIVIILMYCKQQLQLLVDMFWCQIYFSKKCLFLCRIFLDFSMFYAQTQNLCVKWQPQLYAILLYLQFQIVPSIYLAGISIFWHRIRIFIYPYISHLQLFFYIVVFFCYSCLFNFFYCFQLVLSLSE
eukprot:TRINITY_DN1448_c0_g1_i13.p1 TRINITY_DN1448_c0_g1~~TRINITY_DN1448_c0_g1_i13.p1  ORF type:complete len:202 (+),score=-27.78 TRINITY_DN1448_c0_g1_i13:108-713(+)